MTEKYNTILKKYEDHFPWCEWGAELATDKGKMEWGRWSGPKKHGFAEIFGLG